MVKFGAYSDEELREMTSSDYGLYCEKPERLARADGGEASLLKAAYATVHAKRAKEYGSFSDNVETAACIFNLLRRKTGQDYVNKQDVAWMMLCLKLAREATKHKRDNLLDAAGYLELIDELLDGQKGESE